jgi:hypothetical protein
MHKLTVLVAAACAFGVAPLLSRLGPVLGPACTMALALLLASAASGRLSALAITAGAAGAFGSGVLDVASSAIAGACLIGFAFAERTVRVRTPLAKAAHVAVALASGAIAAALSSAYIAATVEVRVVAILVAAVLVALPLLIEADDPTAYALEGAALSLGDSVARSLREGADLRRHVDATLLHRDTRRSVARTWRSLLGLAEARLRLERTRGVQSRGVRGESAESNGALSAANAVVTMLDQKIADHVAALVRTYTAVDTAHAAELGLDDTDSRSVDAAGETLEDVSRAIMEVKT